jgi:hypothetical protein
MFATMTIAVAPRLIIDLAGIDLTLARAFICDLVQICIRISNGGVDEGQPCSTHQHPLPPEDASSHAYSAARREWRRWHTYTSVGGCRSDGPTRRRISFLSDTPTLPSFEESFRQILANHGPQCLDGQFSLRQCPD